MKLTHILLAFLSGILLWLSWPTYGFAGLLFIAFVPLLFVERKLRITRGKRTAGKIFLHSYLTFFIFNIATTYWLYYSTPFGMWFAVLANTALMSSVFLGYHLLARKATQGAALTFLACLWISFESMHLEWDFSWPWLNLGNGFSETTAWIQWYEYTGAFGGSLWIWLVNIFVFLSIVRFRESGLIAKKKFIIKRTSVFLVFILIPILISQAIVLGVSDYRKGDKTQVVIVQPNIDPYEEKYYTTNDSIINIIMNLAIPKIDELTDLIVTPETVLADDVRLKDLKQLDYHPSILNLRQKLYEFPNIQYLGGISVDEVFYDKRRVTDQTNLYRDGRTYYNSYNSAIFLSAYDSLQIYHKSKLVVGVENFPYKSVLKPLLGDAMIDLGGTVSTKTTQKERSIFKLDASSIAAPVICYESVYGEYVSEYVKNGATFLAIITNDAWWENTQGHQQHLSLAKLRAIENRRWIARSANTGISAIIDDHGEIQESLGYELQGVIKGDVYTNKNLTFYTTHGDYIARIALLMGLFILLFSIFKRGTMKRK